MTILYMAKPLAQPKTVYDGKLFTVRHEPRTTADGHTVLYERAYRYPSVSAVAYMSPSRIILLREWRALNNAWEWRLPWGRIDNEEAAPTPRFERIPAPILRAAMQRELQEEAGYRARTLRLIYQRYSGASIVAPTYLFAAHGLTPSQLPPDIDEKIEVHTVSLTRAARMGLSGEIPEEFMGLVLVRLAKKML